MVPTDGTSGGSVDGFWAQIGNVVVGGLNQAIEHQFQQPQATAQITAPQQQQQQKTGMQTSTMIVIAVAAAAALLLIIRKRGG